MVAGDVGGAAFLRGGGNGVEVVVALVRQRPHRCQIGKGLRRSVTGLVCIVVGVVDCERVGEGGVVVVGELVVGVVVDGEVEVGVVVVVVVVEVNGVVVVIVEVLVLALLCHRPHRCQIGRDFV